MRGMTSSPYDERPPPPPLRYSSGSGNRGQEVLDLKPLPKEPAETKKKKTMNPFVKKHKEKKENSEKPVISAPSNFEHTVHVGFDPITKEFTGMPEAWMRLLTDAQISKYEQQQNPQAVIDALDFFTNKEPTNSKWLPYDMNDCSPRPSTGFSMATVSSGYSSASLPHHYSHSTNPYAPAPHYKVCLRWGSHWEGTRNVKHRRFSPSEPQILVRKDRFHVIIEKFLRYSLLPHHRKADCLRQHLLNETSSSPEAKMRVRRFCCRNRRVLFPRQHVEGAQPFVEGHE